MVVNKVFFKHKETGHECFCIATDEKVIAHLTQYGYAEQKQSVQKSTPKKSTPKPQPKKEPVAMEKKVVEEKAKIPPAPKM